MFASVVTHSRCFKLCLKCSVLFHFSSGYCFSTSCKIQVILCSLLWNNIYHQVFLPLDLACLTPRLTMYMHMTELLKSLALHLRISHIVECCFSDWLLTDWLLLCTLCTTLTLAESLFCCFFSGKLGCLSWTWTGANLAGMSKAGCTTCPCLPWQIPTVSSAFSGWAVTLSIKWVMSELSAIMASESLVEIGCSLM